MVKNLNYKSKNVTIAKEDREDTIFAFVRNYQNSPTAKKGDGPGVQSKNIQTDRGPLYEGPTINDNNKGDYNSTYSQQLNDILMNKKDKLPRKGSYVK